MKYIRYEIQERSYSSNIVIGIYEVWNNHKNRYEEHKEPVIAPLVTKRLGDQYAEKVCELLNKTNIIE